MSAARSSRSLKFRSSKKMKKASPAVTAARAPWVFDGIDYGPARAALRDLANWALDIAERAVDDWPSGRQHVRNTRKFVLARVEGKKPRHVATDDILFTAELLARIFDEDLDLGLSEALTILEMLELPVDAVAMHRPTPRMPAIASVVPMLASITPLIAPALHTLANAMQAAPATPVAPLRLCDECGYVHERGLHLGHRNAA